MLNWFRSQSGPEKLITVSAALLLLGLGLCGAAFGVAGANVALRFIINAGVVAFWFGALGLIVGVFWTTLDSIFRKGPR